MKKFYKFLCIALSVLMFLSAVSFPVFAANDTTTQSYLFSSKYTATLKQYTDYKAVKYDTLQFAIPGISNGTTGGVKIRNGFFTDYTPQGVTYNNHTQKFYVSAYSESKENTVVFVLSKTGTYERTLEIDNFTGHAGGIASDNRYLYVVSGLSIYYISLDSITTALQASTNTVTVQKSRIAVNSSLCQMNVGDYTNSSNKFSSCSFCTYFNGLFWFGEFSLDTEQNDYPYRASGESYFFGVDLSNLSAPVLKKVMTVPCKTQGASFFKNSAGEVYLVCSMSYGRNNSSTLRFYKINQSEWGSDAGEGTGTQSSTGVTKFVHKNSNIKQLTMPNMMEDICTAVSSSKLYLVSMYESGAKKYYDSASYVMDRVSAIDINSVLSITASTAQPTVQHYYVQTGITQPDCTHTGTRVNTCSVCSKQQSQSIAALGHTGDTVAHTTAVHDGGAAITYFECERCHTTWGATYSDGTYAKDSSNEQAAVDGEANLAAVEANTAAADMMAPAPAFNNFSVAFAEGTYNYSTRGASLRIDYTSEFDTRLGDRGDATPQDLRFSGALTVPAGVSCQIGSQEDNVLTDFGFVYTQYRYISGSDKLVIGGTTDVDVKGDGTTYPISQMSLRAKNSTNGNFDGTNWKGVTARDVDGKTRLTFNLVIAVKAKNWNYLYAARPYIQYRYHGVEYTVYDEGTINTGNKYSVNSVAYVANAVVNDETISQMERDYFQHKVLDHIGDMPGYEG